MVNVLNFHRQNDERVSYHRCWRQTNLWLQKRKFRSEDECLQKQNRYFKDITLKFIGRTVHVMFCSPGLGHLRWETFSILISTRALIVLLLLCVWCNRTILVPLIRFQRIQKELTPDLNCFPWWHYWVLVQHGGENHQPSSKFIEHPYYAVGFVLGAKSLQLNWGGKTYTYEIIREQQRPNRVELTLSAVETQRKERSVWAR